MAQITPFLTEARLRQIAAMPKARIRVAMQIAGREEWQRCKDDIFYWVDASRHPIPYVFTKDEHPMYSCALCADNEPHVGKLRKEHLKLFHEINVSDIMDINAHFAQIPAIRPYPFREYIRPIYNVLLTEELVAIPKSRDMFATWLVVTFFAWKVLFHEGAQCIFQSENAMKTRELVKRVETIYRNQPKWLQAVHPGKFAEGVSKAGLFTVDSLQSEIIGFPQGADKIRQYHPTAVFSDEAAFNPNAADTFAAVRPAIQNGGQYVAISSANPGWMQHLCEDSLETA